ncbi:MAG TPA: phospholipid carrier-dependent glycosyltransferase [Chloroflexi bacterium]|nr:phospholipid carrier-dependent glycosyltransferase [Chloroflexota bacterium]
MLVLLAYLILAAAYALNSPIYEPSDELRHVRYVRHLAVYRDLPVQTTEGPRAQSHHPPLYYALSALASGWAPVEKDVYDTPPANRYWGYRYWSISNDNKNQYLHGEDERFPFRDVALAVYLMRGLNILLGAGTVWLTHRAGRDIFPNHPGVAIAGAAIVAFNPQFIYLSAAVNNDIMAAFFGAAILWACTRLIQRGPSRCMDVGLGILYGLALLTKFHLLVLLAPIGLSYLLATWPTSRHADSPNWRASIKRMASGLLVVLGLAVLIAGWWFGRNYVLYGDLTGMNKVNELWAGRAAAEHLWTLPQSLPYLWSSLWGRFGYGQIPMPPVVYHTLLTFCAISLLGYANKAERRRPDGRLLLVIFPLTFVAVVSYYILIQPAGAMGRFLFPALPAFAMLVTRGFSRLLPQRLTEIASGAITIAMLALAVYALAAVLAPAYARPTPLDPAEIEAIPNRSAAAQFGETARLLGYRVSPTRAKPGETVDVTVYWQALAPTERDYAIFVHLLSEPGAIMVTQRDTYPGLGRYPTSAWEPGVVFADVYRLFVPEAAYAPDRAYVQVGLYQPDGPRLTTPDGRDAVRLETVEIDAHPGEIPNPINVNFGNRITLAGYRLDRRAAHPGEAITLTLYWQAQVNLQKDYRIFAHVLGINDQVWANTDSPPGVPSSQWHPGEIVQDVRPLQVGETTPPDFYDIEVGVYRFEDGHLRVIAADGRPLDKHVLLSKIRVLARERE